MRYGRLIEKGQQDKKVHLKGHICRGCRVPKANDSQLLRHRRTHQKDCLMGPPIKLCQPGDRSPIPCKGRVPVSGSRCSPELSKT